MKHQAELLDRARRAAVFVAALAASVAVSLSGAAPASADGEAPLTDDIIVGETTQLPDSAVANMEVTDAGHVADLLAEHVEDGGSPEVLTRPVTVYEFDDTVVVATADVEMVALVGENADGEQVTVLAPESEAPLATGSSGYAVPPNGQFEYLRDSYLSDTVGTWKREIWYVWNKANNWKACDTCAGHDYFRGTYRMRASTLTGSGPNEGFKRAWMELDFGGASGYSSFEPATPQESYKGDADQTVTIGFGVTAGVSLGAAPKTASGSLTLSYQGTMTRASENWHPIVRQENLTGGVEWCRYMSEEFTGTKMITARVSAKRDPGGTSQPGFIILRGMSDSTSNCPNQL